MQRPLFDQLWTNARIATMQGDGLDLGLIEHGAITSLNERITWIGNARDAPVADAAIVHDCAGALMTPGLIDCHTHLVFAGNRALEFEMRLNGASYEGIANAGGGILATVQATRDATESALLEQSEARLLALMAEGVTTIEIKSGYGLDLESEKKMLRVARQLGQRNAINVVTTFLGAHAVPPAFSGRADDYIDFICAKVLPVIAHENLADAVDAYCDDIGFTRAQTQRIFEAARRYGLPVKLHAEQLSNQRGAALAADFGALSADHLEYLDEAGVQAMADAGTVAVLLPGAFYVLRASRLPPIGSLRKAGVAMATRLWAVRLAEYGIDCYEVRPGIIASDMTSGVHAKYDALIQNGLLLDGRWGTPDDVGRVVATLVRGDLPYSTGSVLTVDGGLTVPRL